LKSRVDSLKEEPDWRDKWKKRLKEKTEKRKQDYLEEKQRLRQDDDNCSVVASHGGDSKASFLFGGDALTVSSSKTQGNIFQF
jgi:RNA processing factor Prp31